jgi:hypothetical protein
MSVEWEETQVLGRVELYTSRVRGQRSCDSQQVARVCAVYLMCALGVKTSVADSMVHRQRFLTFVAMFRKTQVEEQSV